MSTRIKWFSVQWSGGHLVGARGLPLYTEHGGRSADGGGRQRRDAERIQRFQKTIKRLGVGERRHARGNEFNQARANVFDATTHMTMH